MARRKPTLQLTGNDDRNFGRPTKFKGGAGLGLLGHYDDSDDEIENETDKGSDDEQTIPVSTLDSKVADFLKEINDLENDTPPPSKRSTKDEPAAVKAKEKVTDDEDSQDFKIVWGPWKQCVDENTNHPYYWNTNTNEVSWTLPEDVMKQYEGQTADKSQKVDKQPIEVKTKPKTKEIEEPKSEKPAPKKEDLLISRTSLKAVLEEKRRELEKRQKKTSSKQSLPQSERASRKLKKHSESGTDKFDIDAELDNALDSSEIPAKRPKQDKTEETSILKEDKTSLFSTTQDKVDNKCSKTDKQSDHESDDMDICDDLSKYDMTELLPGGSTLSPAVSRSQSPFASKPIEQVKESKTPVPSPLIEDNTSKMNDNSQQKEIEELTSTLTGKLQFLDISQNSLTDFHKLLMEIEVRSVDWKAGELSSDYYQEKLKQAEQQLEKYETNAVPEGWSCQWDSEYSRYFYKNKLTEEVQWSFPKNVSDEKAGDSVSDTSKEADTNKESSKKSDNNKDNPSGRKSPTEKSKETKDSATAQNHSQNDKKPVGTFPKPEGGPGAMNCPGFNNYQQYWNMANQYGMHYGQPYGMSAYNNSFRNSPRRTDVPLPPGEDTAPPPPTDDIAKPPLPPAPPADAEDSIPPPPPPPLGDPDVDDGTEMEISDVESSETLTTGTPSLQVTAELRRAPVEYSSLPAPPLPTARATTFTTKPQEPPFSSIHTNIKDSTSEKTKKLKKTKKDKSATKKPPREMVGMVAKWQKAKKEIEEEEKRLIMESEEELIKESDPKYRIKKWREEQFQSGKAASNANFEPISDDWRKRIKQRKKVT